MKQEEILKFKKEINEIIDNHLSNGNDHNSKMIIQQLVSFFNKIKTMYDSNDSECTDSESSNDNAEHTDLLSYVDEDYCLLKENHNESELVTNLDDDYIKKLSNVVKSNIPNPFFDIN